MSYFIITLIAALIPVLIHRVKSISTKFVVITLVAPLICLVCVFHFQHGSANESDLTSLVNSSTWVQTSVAFATMVYGMLAASFDTKVKALSSEVKSTSLKFGYELSFELEDIFGTGKDSVAKEAEAIIALSLVGQLSDKGSTRLATVDTKQSLIRTEKRAASMNVLKEVDRHQTGTYTKQACLLLSKLPFGLAKYNSQSFN